MNIKQNHPIDLARMAIIKRRNQLYWDSVPEARKRIMRNLGITPVGVVIEDIKDRLIERRETGVITNGNIER